MDLIIGSFKVALIIAQISYVYTHIFSKIIIKQLSPFKHDNSRPVAELDKSHLDYIHITCFLRLFCN